MEPLRLLSVLLCLLTLGTAAAQTKPTNPVSEFIALGRLAYVECKLSMEVDLLEMQTGKASSIYARYTACRDKHKQLLKTKYEAAIPEIPVKSEAATLLKDFYAFWLTSMAGLQPQMNERKLVYGIRTNQDEAELARLGTRLEIELGLE